jgi:hypothetical protein
MVVNEARKPNRLRAAPPADAAAAALDVRPGIAIGPPVPGATGCSDACHFFALGPLNIMLSQQGDTQFVEVAGAAADGVARVELFLADGERERVRLVDNVFAALVPGKENGTPVQRQGVLLRANR